jgi:hypothetical protein
MPRLLLEYASGRKTFVSRFDYSAHVVQQSAISDEKKN